MCPFTIFLKTCKNINHDEYIKSANPNNGFFSHYWKYDECEHILSHLKGLYCPDEHRTLKKVICLQVSTDGKNISTMLSYNQSYVAHYKKSILLVKGFL